MQKIVIIIVILVLIAAGSYYVITNQSAPTIAPLEDEAPEGLGGELFEQVQNPATQLPSSNPFEDTTTSPFGDTTTNPFDEIYKNPFSQ